MNPFFKNQHPDRTPKTPTQFRLGVGWSIWLSLFLALGNSQVLAQLSTPPGVRYLSTNLQAFGIPFQIDADNESFIEVQLYLSRDQGKTWRLQDRQSTDQREFRFEAEGDGQYWFGLKTLNRNRQLVPSGNVVPGLIIVVDTINPQLELQVSSDAAGRIECRWRASDTNLDPDSLKIEYRSSTPVGNQSESWTTVPVNLKGVARNGIYADQIAWWPETTERTVTVRVSIADKAGNRSQQERTLNLAPTPWRHRNESTARSAPEPQVDPYGSSQASQPPAQLNRIETALDVNEVPNLNQPRPRTSSRSQIWNSEPEQFAQPLQATSSTSRSPQTNPNLAPLPSNSFEIQSQDQTAEVSAPSPPLNSAKTSQSPNESFSESSTAGPINQYQGPKPQLAINGEPGFITGDFVSSDLTEEASNWAYGQHDGNASTIDPTPSPQFTQQSSTAIDHVQGVDANLLEKTSPQPLSGNDDSGQQAMMLSSESQNAIARATPQRSAVDPEHEFISDASVQMISSKRFRLNYGIDAIDPSGVARVDLWMTRDDGRTWKSWGSDPDNASPFPVEVEEEGRYGFRIVVHSKDGLTGRGPASGDRPDIIVEVDTQAPMVQILSVPYGRGSEAGRLIINYRVADPHLTLRPVSIYYSSGPEGPWLPIEEGLRNEGRYAWKPNTAVPDRIYLRLEGIDRAGNRGIHQLNQAIDVSGLIPRGTIHGVTPVGP